MENLIELVNAAMLQQYQRTPADYASMHMAITVALPPEGLTWYFTTRRDYEQQEAARIELQRIADLPRFSASFHALRLESAPLFLRREREAAQTHQLAKLSAAWYSDREYRPRYWV